MPAISDSCLDAWKETAQVYLFPPRPCEQLCVPRATTADSFAILHTPIVRSTRGYVNHAEAKVSGPALEALAVRMAYDLGLTPTDVRSRKEGSKDAEVDVVAETQDILFARWHFQCKKLNQVGRDVLVREVGLASVMQAQVVVLVTWGKFKGTVQSFADHVTKNTAMQIVRVNGEIVRRYLRAGGGSDYLRQVFQEIARQNMAIKRRQPTSKLPE